MKGVQSIIFQSNQQAQWGIENHFLCWKYLCLDEGNKGSLWIRGSYFVQTVSLSESENFTLLQTWGTAFPHLLVINTYGQS